MKTSVERRGRTERGQSLVELAISLTVMLLLLSGAVSFGMALFSYVALRDAAQEGALYGSMNPYFDQDGNAQYDPATDPVNWTGVVGRIRASSTSPIDFADTSVVPDSYIHVTATNGTGTACEGSVGTVPNAVQVRVEYDYPIFMPFVGAIIGNQNIHLTATVTDTILEPHCPGP